jgi:hypothetical protein
MGGEMSKQTCPTCGCQETREIDQARECDRCKTIFAALIGQPQISTATALELLEACENVKRYFWEPIGDKPFLNEGDVQSLLESAIAKARAELGQGGESD